MSKPRKRETAKYNGPFIRWLHITPEEKFVQWERLHNARAELRALLGPNYWRHEHSSNLSRAVADIAEAAYWRGVADGKSQAFHSSVGCDSDYVVWKWDNGGRGKVRREGR